MDESFRILTIEKVKSNDLSSLDKMRRYREIYIDIVQQRFPVVISGGCIRDILLDKPIRDIDIYVYRYNVDNYLSILERNKIKYSLIEKKDFVEDDILMKESYIGGCEYIKSETKIKLSNGAELDIIGIDENKLTLSAKSISLKHSMGISQCGFDADGLFTSDDFKRDVKDKQITLLRTSCGLEKSMKYFMKLYDKFQYPLRITPKQDDPFNLIMTSATAITSHGFVGAVTGVTA